MKKAQFWYGDFLVAVMILMVIGVLFVFSIKDLTSRGEILKDLILDASDISSTLMTEGYGNTDDWNNGIGVVGFITNDRFDMEKFNQFYELNEDNQRYMLGTFNNAWIYLADRNGNIIARNLDYGSINDIDSENLVHIKRLVFYNGDIHTLGVVVFATV